MRSALLANRASLIFVVHISWATVHDQLRGDRQLAHCFTMQAESLFFLQLCL